MSLRNKIVLLFLCLAIAPLLLVAGFGYWQAKRLATEVVGGSLETSVDLSADELERGLIAVDGQMDRVTASQATRALVSGDLDPDVWRSALEPALAGFAYVDVRVPGAGTIATAGTHPDRDIRCVTRGEARLVTLRRAVQVGGLEAELEGGFWLDQLLRRSPTETPGPLYVFNGTNGAALFSSSCETLEAGLPPGLLGALQATSTGGSRPGRVEYEMGGESRIAIFRRMADRPWGIVATVRADPILAPLNRLQASYWIFVLMMATGTALAFSVLIGRVVRSLEELTTATDRIGEGELNPWLPPPGEDEVGRLSLAFSGMLERIRQMMQKVDQSGRLAVVGQLASYLAHEIRNPLSSIRMNLQTLQREVSRGRVPEDCGESIEISLREVDRLTGSLTSVLQLGRPASGAREVVSVHDVVQEAVDLLAGEFRRARVQVSLELDAAADRVMSVPGQLKGVFLNLMMNAVEAQPDGGRLEIRSRLVSTPAGGPLVAVHLRDQGKGVSPEVRERIFEPFYTTKSKGSGIGLAVALRTVREHGGDLYLAELPETVPGCEFVVDLPLAAVVAETIPEPSVHLPSWMDSRDSARRQPWSEADRRDLEHRATRNAEADRIQAFIALSNSEQGEVH